MLACPSFICFFELAVSFGERFFPFTVPSSVQELPILSHHTRNPATKLLPNPAYHISVYQLISIKAISLSRRVSDEIFNVGHAFLILFMAESIHWCSSSHSGFSRFLIPYHFFSFWLIGLQKCIMNVLRSCCFLYSWKVLYHCNNLISFHHSKSLLLLWWLIWTSLWRPNTCVSADISSYCKAGTTFCFSYNLMAFDFFRRLFLRTNSPASLQYYAIPFLLRALDFHKIIWTIHISAS